MSTIAVAEPAVVVHKPFSAPLVTEYKTIATVKSLYHINYTAQSDGKVVEIRMPGDRVVLGETLVRQNDPLKQLALERSRLLASELTASRDLAKLRIEDIDALVASHSLSTRQAQTRRLELTKSQASLDAQLSHSKQLSQSLVLLLTDAVRPGSVIERHANIGEYVAKGDLLLTTVDMTAVQLWVTLPQTLIEQVNDNSQLVLSSFEQSLAVGSIIPNGKTSVQLLSAVFDGSKSAFGHMATQDVVVKLRGDKTLQWFHRDGLTVTDDIAEVKVVNAQGVVSQYRVTVIGEQGLFVAVEQQFRAGEQVILRGMDGLELGAKVRINLDRTEQLQKQFALSGQLESERRTW